MFARDPEREDDLWSEPVVPPSTGWASPLRGAKRSGLPGAGQARLVVGTCVTITWATLELRWPPFCQVCRMWSRLPGRSRLPHDLLTWVCEGPGPARILCLESD